jgi:hypothetical protein
MPDTTTPVSELTTTQLLELVLALTQEQEGLGSQWAAIKSIAQQTALNTRTLQWWLAGRNEPQPRNRLMLEYLLQKLLANANSSPTNSTQRGNTSNASQ